MLSPLKITNTDGDFKGGDFKPSNKHFYLFITKETEVNLKKINKRKQTANHQQRNKNSVQLSISVSTPKM